MPVYSSDYICSDILATSTVYGTHIGLTWVLRMAIKILTVLQVGDIHYPEARKGPLPIDLKDKAFPPGLIQKLGIPPLQAVVREIQGQMRKRQIDAIAFMGDLTHKGDNDGLSECISYIKKSFLDYITSYKASVPAIVVPGNHDVIVPATGITDIESKFGVFNEALKANGLPEICVDQAQQYEITAKGVKAHLYAVNSCVGCSEKRSIPDDVKKQIAEEIKHKLSGAGIDGMDCENILEQAFERLDVPAVHVDAIDRICSDINDAEIDIANILVAHHNLIPQAIPRISPYTEMVNGGDFRASLLDIHKPLIYLHGHVHNDPVEVIKRPRDMGGMIILVSAPMLEDGFNIIEVAFSDANLPLGCSIHPYRLSTSGHIKSGKVISIPFWPHMPNYGVLAQLSRDALSILMASPTTYYGDLVRACEKIAVKIDSEDLLAQALRELQWLGFISIDNHDNPYSHWRIQRAV